jgi:anti-repressor protein
MSKELVPVVQQVLDDESANTVNGRDIWQFLEISRDYSNWIKDQIARLNLVENTDYITYAEKGDGGRFAKIEYFSQ